MAYKKTLLLVFLLTPFLFSSCLYTRSGGAGYVVNRIINVNYGNVILNVQGQVNENVYASFNEKANDVNFYDKPLINEGTRSRNETVYLSQGEKYTVSVVPSEVVTINITSADNNDAEICVSGDGRDRTYTVQGSDRLGLFLAFQSR